MQNDVTTLREFINIAERDRKYAPSTATGYRVALSLFEKELNDKEKESISIFKVQIDAIYQNVYRNNKIKFKSNTLEEYKKRIKKIIQDFETYGDDPAKMAGWNPARPKTVMSRSKTELKNLPLSKENTATPQELGNSDLTRFELPLRSNIKAIILTPPDLTSEEADKIRAYIDYLKSVSRKVGL